MIAASPAKSVTAYQCDLLINSHTFTNINVIHTKENKIFYRLARFTERLNCIGDVFVKDEALLFGNIEKDRH